MNQLPPLPENPRLVQVYKTTGGEPFTRPIIARTNVGARVAGFAAKAEKFVYVELMAEGFHGTHAGNYGFFNRLEWRGPLLLPKDMT